MPSIRITKVPPGDAPLNVRRGWVDVVLPLDTKWGAGARPRRVFGVMSGPRHPLARLLSLLAGRAQRMDGYVVDARRSVEILQGHDQDAAIWWHEFAPHMLAEGKCFVFPADVCEVVPDAPPTARIPSP